MPGEVSLAMATERPLTKDMKVNGEALTLEEYERAGGYQGIRKALGMAPKEVTDVVVKSGLRGRGGAGRCLRPACTSPDLSKVPGSNRGRRRLGAGR